MKIDTGTGFSNCFGSKCKIREKKKREDVKKKRKSLDKAAKKQIYDHKIEIRVLEISKYISSAFNVNYMVRAASENQLFRAWPG